MMTLADHETAPKTILPLRPVVKTIVPSEYPFAFKADGAHDEHDLYADVFSEPHNISVLSTAIRAGVYIVGEAQAGKTTLNAFLAKAWYQLCAGTPNGPCVNFSNSAGFRGLTVAAHLLGYDPSDPQSLQAFLELPNIDELALDYVMNPRGEEVLRTPIVNAHVPYVGDHPDARRAVNTASGARISQHFDDEDNPAGLVVLDARNAGECEYKFKLAQARIVGRFILTCAPSTTVERDASKRKGLRVFGEALRRGLRNARDRNRPEAGGRLTRPEDYHDQVISLADVIDPDHDWHSDPSIQEKLFMLGVMQITDGTYIHIATDDPRVTMEFEEQAMYWILRGATTADYLYGSGVLEKDDSPDWRLQQAMREVMGPKYEKSIQKHRLRDKSYQPTVNHPAGLRR